MSEIKASRDVRIARANATQEGLRLCVEWITSCRGMGWKEGDLPEMEKLFWKYRNADGTPKSNNQNETNLIQNDLPSPPIHKDQEEEMQSLQG